MTVRTHALPRTQSLSLLATLLLATGGAFALALISQVRIPLPFTPVPVTIGVLGVLLLAGLLGPRVGLLAVVEYLLLGAAGAPVFAGWVGGLAAFMGPTTGYLCGYLLAVLICGTLYTQAAAQPYGRRLGAGMLVSLLGVALIYAGGWAWLAFGLKLGVHGAFLAGVVPFALMDLAKAVVAANLLTLWGKR